MSEHAASPTTTSRRSLLKASGLAAASAAIMAACSPDRQKVGVSGDPVVATSTPPTVPVAEATAAVIAAKFSAYPPKGATNTFVTPVQPRIFEIGG